jgi:hypothetical protein
MDLVFAPSQIVTWPIDRLRPYARNAKIHGTDQVAKIAASMAKFGWTVPCMVADDGELIAGHGRVLAAAMLGLKDVPVIRLSHLDEAERRAYRIADNKLTELGEWDEAMLRDEIAGLLAEESHRRSPAHRNPVPSCGFQSPTQPCVRQTPLFWHRPDRQSRQHRFRACRPCKCPHSHACTGGYRAGRGCLTLCAAIAQGV